MALFDIRVDDLPDGLHVFGNSIEGGSLAIRHIGEELRVRMLEGHGTEALLQSFREATQFRFGLLPAPDQAWSCAVRAGVAVVGVV